MNCLSQIPLYKPIAHYPNTNNRAVSLNINEFNQYVNFKGGNFSESEIFSFFVKVDNLINRVVDINAFMYVFEVAFSLIIPFFM